MIEVVVKGDVVVVDGKPHIQTGDRTGARGQRKVYGFAVVAIVMVLRWIATKQMVAAIADFRYILESKPFGGR